MSPSLGSAVMFNLAIWFDSYWTLVESPGSKLDFLVSSPLGSVVMFPTVKLEIWI